MDWSDTAYWLPLAFLGTMGLAILIYAVMDGYDLGVGLLMTDATESERDMMIASIGPFWDANETWLVLSVGLLLVAFPKAHGIVLSGLYMPVTIMLIGLVLRGVAFDFRAKAQTAYKKSWDRLFIAGSAIAALSQGYMLGRYIVGLENTLAVHLFALVSALCVMSAYVLIGACWLIIKTEGVLQQRAIRWARIALPAMCFGLLAVSVVNPMVSSRIYEKWFAFPQVIYLAPLPLLTAALLVITYLSLRKLSTTPDHRCWVPFTSIACVFILAFAGLAYSFFPYVIPDQLTVWDAASDTNSLWVIFIGTVIVLPAILGYTAFSYYVFRGKASALTYL